MLATYPPVTNYTPVREPGRVPHPPTTPEELYIDQALRVAWEQLQRGESIPAEEVDRYFMSKKWT